MNSVLTLEKLKAHKGHEIEIVVYGQPSKPANYSLECVTCYELLADADTDSSGGGK